MIHNSRKKIQANTFGKILVKNDIKKHIPRNLKIKLSRKFKNYSILDFFFFSNIADKPDF